jgi:hypothetical protein
MLVQVQLSFGREDVLGAAVRPLQQLQQNDVHC